MDMLDHLDVDKIYHLNNEELDIIYGGAVSGTLINAITSALKAILDLGRSLGTAARMIKTKSLCSVK